MLLPPPPPDDSENDNVPEPSVVKTCPLLPSDDGNVIPLMLTFPEPLALNSKFAFDEFVFTVCLAYGSREEMLNAIQSIAEEHAAGDLPLDEIDEKAVSQRLYTGEMPDPDLVIRTSGEERISNFLLWQMAYSELYFTDVYWPSFQKKDLLRAVKTFQERKRRYGE